MTLYYVFSTEELAIQAEAQISILGNAPIKGRNAKTGELVDIGETTRWAIPEQRLDGKWVFPKVNDELLAQYSSDIINEFNNAFPNTLEEYNKTWFPSEDE